MMTIYARSDILEEPCRAFPGTSHIRPRRASGEPVPVWGVECTPCEQALAADPRWSRSRFKIPLTPDEEEEAQEALQQARVMQQRLELERARQANNELAASRNAMLTDLMNEDVVVTTAADNRGPVPPQVPVPPQRNYAADYGAFTKAELTELLRERGLSVAGTKAEMVGRLADDARELALSAH
jgi:hypothetical protein